MVHTTGGSEKTDGGKHPRARSGGGVGRERDSRYGDRSMCAHVPRETTRSGRPRLVRAVFYLWLELRRLPQILSPCSFLLWILTHKRFHSNLAIAPTCDTVSTYHITDKARDPQRGLSRATYLLKVSRRAPVACRPQCRGRGRRRSKRSADQRGRSASRDGKRDGGR